MQDCKTAKKSKDCKTCVKGLWRMSLWPWKMLCRSRWGLRNIQKHTSLHRRKRLDVFPPNFVQLDLCQGEWVAETSRSTEKFWAHKQSTKRRFDSSNIFKHWQFLKWVILNENMRNGFIWSSRVDSGESCRQKWAVQKHHVYICFFSSECPCNWHFPMTFLALSRIIKISKICIFSKHGMNHFTTSIWEMCPGAHSSSASQSCSCQKCATWLSRLCPHLGLFPTFFKRLGLTWSQLT